MIDRGDIRQAIDRCSNIWASLQELVMVSSNATGRQPDCKIQRSGRGVDWCLSKSPRLCLFWLSASSSVWLLIITVITPLPTKPTARQKRRREHKPGERGNYWHADASAWCCARCKIHEGVSWYKAQKMMLCVMMLPLVVVGCTSKQSVSQCDDHRLRRG